MVSKHLETNEAASCFHLFLDIWIPRSNPRTRFYILHRKYNKSECRKAVVYSTALHPTFPSCVAFLVCAYVALIALPTVFSMAWYKIVMQHFLVIYGWCDILTIYRPNICKCRIPLNIPRVTYLYLSRGILVNYNSTH